MRVRLAALAALLAAAPAPAAERSPDLERMKRDLFYLAGDECEGRGVETKGILKAGEYVADAFRAAGLKPAGTAGSYFQPFDIPGPVRLGAPNTLTLAGPKGQNVELEYGNDFTPTVMTGTAKVAAGVVFAGYGITADTPALDEYAGLDVKGKYVVVVRRAPRFGQKDAPFPPESQHPSLLGKVENAVGRGAAGVIFVNDEAEKGDALMPFGYARGPSQDVPVLHMKRAALATMFPDHADAERAIDKALKPRSVELKGWTVTAQTTVTQATIPARNVVAVSEGRGPLANETVVVGAHYDHLGRGEPGTLGGPDGKGKIHYGADDNASGTTGLLELARRFGAAKEREGRRVVFIAFSGEERGLYGSLHYCKKPTYPIESTVFMLNMDMIGRVTAVTPGAKDAAAPKDRLLVYGTGTAAGMDDVVTAANRGPDFALTRRAGGTGPSDHDSFYNKRVPVLFLFTGSHNEYHKPTDTPDKVNLPGLKRVADFGERLVAHFATAARPAFQTNGEKWSDPTEPKSASRSSYAGMPKLGIRPGNYEATSGGVLVEGLSPGGAAEKGGVKTEDVVVEIAGKQVKEIETYMSALAGQRAGQEIDVVVLRGGKRVTLKVTPQP